MRKLVRTSLPLEVRTALQDASIRGLTWDGFDKRQERDCLRKMQSNICAYCERKLDSSDGRTRIDHFVPQSSSRGKSRVFDWTNHYLSCDCPDTCDSHKSNDEHVLVNPDTDDPARYFTYLPTGAICVANGLSETDAQKAQDTISVLNLGFYWLANARVIAFNRLLKYANTMVLRQYLQKCVVEYHSFCEFMVKRKQTE